MQGRATLIEPTPDIPATFAHVVLIAASVYTVQKLCEYEDLEFTYGALGIWVIFGILGAVKYGATYPTRRLKKLYSSLKFVRPFVDLPLVLADLYDQSDIPPFMCMVHIIAGLIPLMAHVSNYKEFAKSSGKCVVLSSFVSGLTLMAINKNGMGAAVLVAYCISVYGVYTIEMIRDNPHTEPDGLNAVVLSAFSLVLDKLFYK